MLFNRIRKRWLLAVLLTAAPVVAVPQLLATNQSEHSHPPSQWRGSTESRPFIGVWRPTTPASSNPDGFVAIFPSQTPGVVCLVAQTAQRAYFGEGAISDQTIRTLDQSFLSSRWSHLDYFAGSAFDLEDNRLTWTIAMEQGSTQSSLQFAEEIRPLEQLIAADQLPELQTLFSGTGCAPSGAIDVALSASTANAEAGVSISPVLGSKAQSTTLDGVTIALGEKQLDTSSIIPQIVIPVQITNASDQTFGFLPSSVKVTAANGQALNARYKPALPSNVIRPGGVTTGSLLIFTTSPQTATTIEIEEGSSGGRQFQLLLP